MKRIALNFALVGTILMAASCAKEENHSAQTETMDTKEVAKEQNEEKFEDSNSNLEDASKFAVKAAEMGLLEVKLGELASEKASSSKVKEFAKTMVSDHKVSNTELMTLAQSKNISVPNTLSDDKMDKYSELNSKKGMEFDEAYMEMMVKSHEKTISAFKEESENGKDAEIKAFAASKLSSLEHHRQMAETLEKELDDKK